MAEQKGKRMNRFELELILGQAVRAAAARLGIYRVAYYSVDELREQIRNKDGNVGDLLESFLRNYWEWWNFLRQMENQGKQGKLDQDEVRQHEHHMSERDESRRLLLEQLP